MDLIVQKEQACDLNRSLEVNLDEGSDMKMDMSNSASAHSMEAEPTLAFDSLAWLAIELSAAHTTL